MAKTAASSEVCEDLLFDVDLKSTGGVCQLRKCFQYTLSTPAVSAATSARPFCKGSFAIFAI